MIKNLLIKNYALIQELSMDPSPFFNTITGETGAGKSIMLGALGLLLGNRSDTKVLFEEGQKCVIEGTFDISKLNLESLFEQMELDYLSETIIRREISAAGKSRAFINDTPVTLDVMKTVGNHLVDVHSQRDTYLLGAVGYQLKIIDGYAQNASIFHEYSSIFGNFKKQESAYNSLKLQADALKKESDYNHFLLEELDNANLVEGEHETLEEELRIIEHAEEIKSKLFSSQDLLDNSEFSINSSLQQVVKDMEQISKYGEHFEPLKSRLESCWHELKDISSEIDHESQKVEFDPSRQEEVQERLGLIFQLMQKHHTSEESELITIREELRKKVDKALNMDEELAAAKSKLDQLQKELQASGKSLTSSRVAVFDNFKKELEILLKELAMPYATIDIRNEIKPPSENGMDKITILFSANAGVAPNDLKNVASGGEFSRLMFCIKYILAGKTSLPTIIFDEIDTGISGEVSLKLVTMMKEMSQRHQVIAITHLPQIAASGDAHYFVFKEHNDGRTFSRIKKLESSEREEELAKMIGGDNPSEVALKNARELLAR